MKNLKILSLEDDANLATVTRLYLEEESVDLLQVSTGAECLSALNEKSFDIILMDLGLPDVDGLTLISKIRQIYPGPIIVISGKTTTTDRVVGLEMGADDYITKPFEMRELLARIKANVRRESVSPTQPDNTADSVYQFYDFTYDTSKLLLKQKNEPVNLTSGEGELLLLFLNSNGRVLSREYLFDQTRSGNFEAFDRAVDIAVTRLRKKLHDDPSNPQIIKTVRGTGYMFIADVEIMTATQKRSQV